MTLIPCFISSFLVFAFFFLHLDGHGLHAHDPLLNEISKFFVTHQGVDLLAAVLLRDIPPHGPTFVKMHKTADTEWEQVALEAMRTWYVECM